MNEGMMRTGLWPGMAGMILLVAAGLAGCTTPDVRPEASVPQAEGFSESGEAVLADRWWRAFDDPRLDALVEEALGSNLELDSALARLREARAVARIEAAPRSVQVDGEAAGRRADPGDEGLSLGLAADYEVDLWGRIDSLAQAAEYQARAREADYRAAAITLSAEVARTWYGLQAAHAQAGLIREQLAANRQVRDLVKTRVTIGQRNRADLLRQEQLLESTREELHAIEARIGVLEHQLSVLLGRAPQAGIEYRATGLPALPPLPDTGLPADLVQRRPDIQRVFHELRAADESLAAAISNRYPRLSLSASLTTTSEGPDELFRDWIETLAANLTAPLVDGGRREAAVDEARAVVDRQLAAYRQATLAAYREVEDALVQEAGQRKTLQSVQRQRELAAETVERLRQQYFNGIGNYIDVLTAQTERQRLQRDQISARRDLVEFRIALYRALAGGFDTPELSRTTVP